MKPPETLPPAEFGGQGNNKQPRPKIRGSQFVKREEKVQVKQKPIVVWILPWKRKKP